MASGGCVTDWSNVTLATFNQSLLENPALCTPCTCPLTLQGIQLAWIDYYPTLAGNVLFAAIFGILFVLQIFLGIRHKTRGFMIAMSLGLILEIIGYVGRILLRGSMFEFSYFLMYLICLTIGPAFFSAAIYFTLSRIIVVYVPERARFRPQTYTYIFITFDVIALILQAAGGAVAASEPANSAGAKSGIDVMVAGVAWQVASMAIFGLLSLDYLWRVMHRNPVIHHPNPAFDTLRAKKSFQPHFMIGLFFSALFIFVRSVFRCAELSGGFSGPLANEEITFMILEGTMIILACSLLTAFHPGRVMGTAGWAISSWKNGRSSKV